jgi:magnesium-transporting ATPase (P-type)
MTDRQDRVEQRPRGLTRVEVARRLAEHGFNTLLETKRVHLGQRLARQFKSALIYILFVALAVDLVLWLHEAGAGGPYEAVAIDLVLMVNAGLGAYSVVPRRPRAGSASRKHARSRLLAG